MNKFSSYSIKGVFGEKCMFSFLRIGQEANCSQSIGESIIYRNVTDVLVEFSMAEYINIGDNTM